MKGGTETFLIFSALHIVSCFNVDREEFAPERNHSISKRASVLKKTCNAELYEGPLPNTCKLPSTQKSLLADAKKCQTTLKAKTLSDAEAVCLWDCAYQAKKWVSKTGTLDQKLITTDFNKGVDKTWASIVTAAVKSCLTDATKASTAKLASGYVTKCKTAAYFFNTCFRVKLYSGCPKTAQSGSYTTVKTALAACDFAAITKSASQLAASGMSALKKMNPKDIMSGLEAAKKDPSAVKTLLGGAKPEDLLKSMSGAGVKTDDLKKLAGGADFSKYASLLTG
ncbi:Hypothetical predicted protein [Cloeon dipterum]|uniref:Uncharacterized protein n=1 Tax=Cloeon dipterum TaxID=197152 RepID=A0A8S1BY35_9INSE|nr:Hypothetical predicted protein [Cloeon dipterum]